MTVQENVSLKDLNTMGIEATARYYCEVTSIEMLQALLSHPDYRSMPRLILGGGSNLLFTQDPQGLVIKISILGKDVLEEHEQEVVVKVGAGENWHQFVLYALERNWGGIENLSLIPGTLGAAPMQNIGAYGVEIKSVFESLEAVALKDGSLRTFSNQDCHFGYRESVFKNTLKGKYIIASVTLRLSKQPEINTSYGAIQDTLRSMGIVQPTIQDVSKAVIHIRESKLPNPKEIGNAGSFFKNPVIDKVDYEGLQEEFPSIPGYPNPGNKVKVPAAWLIEQCGWKGYRMGDIGVHQKQALVLVNYGQGQGRDLETLSKKIRESVADKFGIELHPEVNIV